MRNNNLNKESIMAGKTPMRGEGKCPDCGGAMKNGKCAKCGYTAKKTAPAKGKSPFPPKKKGKRDTGRELDY